MAQLRYCKFTRFLSVINENFVFISFKTAKRELCSGSLAQLRPPIALAKHRQYGLPINFAGERNSVRVLLRGAFDWQEAEDLLL
jgi:hypothetical protein